MHYVFVDTDAADQKLRDPDDCLAIFCLVKICSIHPETYTLCGVSTVHGNSTAKKSAEVLRKMRDQLNESYVNFEIFQGAEKKTKKFERTAASDALVNFITMDVQRKDTKTIIGIGPLTNIATSIAFTTPEKRSTTKLFLMGGAFNPLRNDFRLKMFVYFGEFNWKKDPEATNFVLSAPGVSVVTVPMEACVRSFLDKKALKRIRANGSEPVRHALRNMKSWSLVNRIAFGKKGIVPWDVLPVMFFISYYSCEQDLDSQDFGLDYVGSVSVRSGSLFRNGSVIVPNGYWNNNVGAAVSIARPFYSIGSRIEEHLLPIARGELV